MRRRFDRRPARREGVGVVGVCRTVVVERSWRRSAIPTRRVPVLDVGGS